MAASKRTDVTLWDRVVLKQKLLSGPRQIRQVLRHFKECQIECLADLEVFRIISVENPSAAERIIAEAQEMGIPVELDELIDDVLSGPPGEV